MTEKEKELVQVLFSYFKNAGIYDFMTEEEKEEIKQKYLDNPPYIRILSPEGEVYEYTLAHTDVHLTGYQKFCDEVLSKKGIIPNEDVYNDYQPIEQYIVDHQYFILKTWLDLRSFDLYCQIAQPDTITLNQQQRIDQIYQNHLNDENSSLLEEYRNQKLYTIDQPFTKNKMK